MGLACGPRRYPQTEVFGDLFADCDEESCGTDIS